MAVQARQIQLQYYLVKLCRVGENGNTTGGTGGSPFAARLWLSHNHDRLGVSTTNIGVFMTGATILESSVYILILQRYVIKGRSLYEDIQGTSRSDLEPKGLLEKVQISCSLSACFV